MLFHYGNCRNDVESLTKDKTKLTKEIADLNSQIVTLIGEVQESKAVYNYQVGELEKKIQELQSNLDEHKCFVECEHGDADSSQDDVVLKLSQDNTKLNDQVTYLEATNNDLSKQNANLLAEIESLRKDFKAHKAGAVAVKAGKPKRTGHITTTTFDDGTTIKSVDYTKPDGETVVNAKV